MSTELEHIGPENGQFPLTQSIVRELGRAVETILSVGDADYRHKANWTGSVGGQFRHILDFVNCFLNGVDAGRIDYSLRERDLMVETDREYAARRFSETIRRVSELPPRHLARSILVRSEADPDTWLPSSLAREAEFVHSHAVHHHALIGEKLAGTDAVILPDLGVAPSTLEYWRQSAG